MRKNKTPRCLVCRKGRLSPQYFIARYGFSVYACAECGSLCQYPLPRNPAQFYDEDYYTGKAHYSYQDERQKEHYHNFVHHARLATIRRFVPNLPFKFLDVGCAFGAFVRAAACYGEAYGIDISPFAVREGNRLCKAAGVQARLFQGELTKLPRTALARRVFQPESFAVITLIEVAEHLPNPPAAFRSAFRLLVPGGLLVVQTANFEGWQAIRAGADYHYFLPGHLVYYTARGLKQLLKEIGFREFYEFFPTDFPLWAKWRKAWGDVHQFSDLARYFQMSLYHLRSKLRWRGHPLTSSYVLYAKK
ncbi:MAG: class I SAM-dependent methyltransferase [Turneriella sp.]|nr:class I SAM-dependent methyltransferase [Turneriella sp.]